MTQHNNHGQGLDPVSTTVCMAAVNKKLFSNYFFICFWQVLIALLLLPKSLKVEFRRVISNSSLSREDEGVGEVMPYSKGNPLQDS